MYRRIKAMIVCLLMCMLTSCVVHSDYSNEVAQLPRNESMDRVGEYTYKGHDYIMWYSPSHKAAAVHNPECTNKECAKIRKNLLNLN